MAGPNFEFQDDLGDWTLSGSKARDARRRIGEVLHEQRQKEYIAQMRAEIFPPGEAEDVTLDAEPPRYPDAESDVKCPKCPCPMHLIHGKNGPFYGCTTYPKCKGSVDATPTGAPKGTFERMPRTQWQRLMEDD